MLEKSLQASEEREKTTSTQGQLQRNWILRMWATRSLLITPSTFTMTSSLMWYSPSSVRHMWCSFPSQNAYGSIWSSICTQGALGVPCEGWQWQNCWKESHEKEDDQWVLLSANRMLGETSSLLLERAHSNQRWNCNHAERKSQETSMWYFPH